MVPSLQNNLGIKPAPPPYQNNKIIINHTKFNYRIKQVQNSGYLRAISAIFDWIIWSLEMGAPKDWRLDE